jgi:hypothetical protein
MAEASRPPGRGRKAPTGTARGTVPGAARRRRRATIMTQLTEHLIRLQHGMGNLATAVLPRAARWGCACAFFAMGLVSQAQDTALPNTTVTSGSSSYAAIGALTAGTSSTYPGAVFVVNNSPTDGASVTFTAGIIQLEPGFHAIAGTAATTFHAIIEPPLPQTGTFAQASGISTFTASSAIGYQYIDQVHALFNWTVDGIDGCYVMYLRAANAVYLMNDTGTQWLGGQAPGDVGRHGAEQPMPIEYRGDHRRGLRQHPDGAFRDRFPAGLRRAAKRL